MKRILWTLAAFFLASGVNAAALTHQATLTWVQSGDPIALNCVARSATSGGEDFTKPLWCSATPITQYVDPAVNAGDIWYYQVDAVNAKGFASAGSNEVKTVIPLQTPSGLQVTSQ